MKFEDGPYSYVEESKTELFNELEKINWERCVTLTASVPLDEVSLTKEMVNFVRRVAGRRGEQVQYWLAICQHPRSRREYDEFDEGRLTPLHVHGLLRNVDPLLNKHVEACWRTIPAVYTPKHSIISSVRPFPIGYSKIVHYDNSGDWIWYVLNQTMYGEIFTNITEIK
jgi:hypothetical protein